jgi:putative glutamine amidotransferase
MAPLTIPDSTAVRLRIGIPWRTSQEERNQKRQKLDYYFVAVQQAGAEPVAISLQQSRTMLDDQVDLLDGFVLPGSPTDVDPRLYGAPKHPETAEHDENRDRTDSAILDHAFANRKPVLAICYGCQSLNVFLGGTLIQDLPSELPGGLSHGKTDLAAAANPADLEHDATLAADSRLAMINGSEQAKINTSHHQAIATLGKDLRATAQAPDGVIEAVEWAGDGNWVVGVQWHPERMVGDAFATRLFEAFVTSVRTVRAARGALAQSQ